MDILEASATLPPMPRLEEVMPRKNSELNDQKG